MNNKRRRMFGKKGFTLVELIIVIAIIAILAVTAFLLLTKWLAKARDSRRISDLNTIDSALQMYMLENTTVPRPDSAVTISANGTTIGYQGIFSDNIKSALSNLSSTPIDPSDNISYIYYTDATQKNYQILGFTENLMSYYGNSVNAVDYSNRYIQTKGNKLGILLDTSNNPVNLVSGLTGLDVQNTTGTYNAYFDNANKLSGTGLTLQWLYQNANNGGNGFGAPSSCPTGFIPVPGNKDFNQPGFCVAKYEMKQINGTAGYRNTGNARTTGINEICGTGATIICRDTTDTTKATTRLNGQIVSKADGLPIVNLNQATAIEACSKMGAGYHLITNNEYMTIARNIQQQGQNRTGGAVGVGGIYRGKNMRGNNGIFTGNTDKNRLDCNMGTDIYGNETTGSLVANANSTACSLGSRNKRELYLSNGQIIWDLAGNVWEHVNKANTIDGTGYVNGLLSYADIDTTLANWDGGTSTTTARHKAGWNGTAIISDARNKYGPSSSAYGWDQGMGNVHGNLATTTNVFLRGGRGSHGAYAGVFTLGLDRAATSRGYNVGFRCVK